MPAEKSKELADLRRRLRNHSGRWNRLNKRMIALLEDRDELIREAAGELPEREIADLLGDQVSNVRVHQIIHGR